MFQRLLAILVIACCAFTAQAKHIVGGEFYYKKIGTNRYTVTLKLFLDCDPANQGSIQSDFTATVGVWDAGTRTLIRTEKFSRTGPTNLNKEHYQCLTPPKDVCVAQYIYQKTMTIDPGKNGVTLAFERCCRNNGITNILSPEATGATYWVTIPGTDLVANNSSAVFNELPPNYLCIDAPLQFDHSATDPDGDSLVYELFTPYTGASRTQPQPDGGAGGNLSRPPFDNITWLGTYSVNNQIAGDPSLEINRTTGEITATPTAVGQYVIGIKVIEFRNGVKIGETYRDYQFNVRKCQTTLVSNFRTGAGSSFSSYNCSDTVQFVNLSQKADVFRWDFGDLTTLADTSWEANPTYVYPGNGEYLATLYAKNEVCEATFKLIVKVKSEIEVDLGPDIYFCNSVNQLLTPKIFNATKISWNTGQFGVSIQAKSEGTYVSTVYYGSCTGSDSVDVIADPVILDQMLDDTLFCEPEDIDVVLDAGLDAAKSYRWSTSFADTFRTLHVQGIPGTYWVRVMNEHCTGVDSTVIYTSTKPKLDPYWFVCNEFERELDPGDIPDNATYLWSNGTTTRTNTVTKPGLHWVEVKQKHCTSRDSMFIENPVINLELGNDTNYCDDLSRTLTAPKFMASYLWQDGASTQTYQTINPGKYYVLVTDTNGCTKSDTILLTKTNSPIIDIGADTTICVRSRVTYGIEESFASYEWHNGETTPYIEVSDSGFIFLKVIDNNGCSGRDTAYVAVDENALPNELFIPSAFSPNDDGLNEVFPFRDIIYQPEYHFQLFNLWGEKIFDSNWNGEQSWDATYQGKEVAQDVYMYIIDYRACNGTKKQAVGSVQVMR